MYTGALIRLDKDCTETKISCGQVGPRDRKGREGKNHQVPVPCGGERRKIKGGAFCQSQSPNSSLKDKVKEIKREGSLSVTLSQTQEGELGRGDSSIVYA